MNKKGDIFLKLFFIAICVQGFMLTMFMSFTEVKQSKVQYTVKQYSDDGKILNEWKHVYYYKMNDESVKLTTQDGNKINISAGSNLVTEQEIN